MSKRSIFPPAPRASRWIAACLRHRALGVCRAGCCSTCCLVWRSEVRVRFFVSAEHGLEYHERLRCGWMDALRTGADRGVGGAGAPDWCKRRARLLLRPAQSLATRHEREHQRTVKRPGFSGGSVLPTAVAGGRSSDGCSGPRTRRVGRDRSRRGVGSR
jgi:hypothetical protein